MLVAGDETHEVVTADLVARLTADASALGALDGGDRHDATVRMFIALAGLLQGVADAEFAQSGMDDGSRAQDAVMTHLRTVARGIARSWSGDGAHLDAFDLSGLADLALPPTVSIRRCEGYAFYALYPELYAIAAKAVPRGAIVIGLRSIGTGLAAMVAAACDARAVVTLRPVGPPFARSVRVGAGPTGLVTERRDATFVLVDEGPGLSGSSLGGVADWLEGEGVSRDRIVFMPSHAGSLGREASEAHRARWTAARRLVASFEADVAPRLPGWFANVTGPATMHDLSGGRWRDDADIPADPARETRKYLIEGDRGRFLAKFVGLDEAADTALDHARRLHGAGFGAEPVALRHGFLLERFVEGRRFARDEPGVASLLARNLAFRAANFLAPQGASVADLVAMARQNIGEALGAEAAAIFADWTLDRIAVVQAQVRPVHVDARLHPWEWLSTATGPIKTDALAHGRAHDLVGGQDIAWDVAGALIEFDLSPDERDMLIAAVLGPEREDLLACMGLCYLGFQIGWWSFSGDPAGAALVGFYVERVRDLLKHPFVSSEVEKLGPASRLRSKLTD